MRSTHVGHVAASVEFGFAVDEALGTLLSHAPAPHPTLHFYPLAVRRQQPSTESALPYLDWMAGVTFFL